MIGVMQCNPFRRPAAVSVCPGCGLSIAVTKARLLLLDLTPQDLHRRRAADKMVIRMMKIMMISMMIRMVVVVAAARRRRLLW